MASYEELRSYARIIRNETKSSANTALRIGEMYLNIIDKMEDVDDRFKDFLTGTDTDTIINRWKELESFLNGYTETSTLAELLSGKADKATTLAGYGITNAYTKTEVDNKITSVNTSVTTLQATVSGHTTSINSLQSTVSGHTSSITSINSKITTLQGYFTNGVANSALRLSDGAEYKAWGQVFFKDGKPVNVSGAGTFTQVNADSVLFKGKARLSYDSTLDALLLTKDDGTAVHFLASGAVATRGLGEIEEGGGGTGTGVDLLNVPSDIIPSVGGSYSLGSSANAWKMIYVNGGIIGNTYIDSVRVIFGTYIQGQSWAINPDGSASLGSITSNGEPVATRNWVNSQSFAKTSDLTSINNNISSLQASTFTGANAPEGKGYTLTWFTQSGGGRNVTIPAYGEVGTVATDGLAGIGQNVALVDQWLIADLMDYIADVAAGGQVDLSNYVTLNSAQTISGMKTFTGGITASRLYSVDYLDSSELTINAEKVNFIYDGDDADVQIGLINGYKPLTLGNTSFSPALTSGTVIGTITIGGESKTIYAPSSSNVDLSNYVTLDGEQTITGSKYFSDLNANSIYLQGFELKPHSLDDRTPDRLMYDGYVLLDEYNYSEYLNNVYVTLNTEQTISGTKTFSQDIVGNVTGSSQFIGNNPTKNTNAKSFQIYSGTMLTDSEIDEWNSPFGKYTEDDGSVFDFGSVLRVRYSANYYTDLWFDANSTENNTIAYRRVVSNNIHDWVRILTDKNFSTHLDSSYVKKSGDTMTGKLGFSGSTYPHIYGNGNYLILAGASNETVKSVIVEKYGFRPYTNNNMPLGISGNRWSNVYSVLGNFSGQITSTVANGTSPFVVASKSLVKNLNAEYVNGYTVNRAGFVTNTDGTTTMIPTLDKQCNVYFSVALSSYWTKFATITALGNNSTVIVTLLVGNEHQGDRYQGRGILECKIRNANSTPSIYFSAVSGDIDCSSFRCYYPTTISSGTEIELWVNVKRSWNSAVIRVLNETSAYAPINVVKMFTGARSSVETPTLEDYVEPERVSLATKLSTARTLWGQSFDGSGNISGDLTGVGNIYGTGAVTINSVNNVIALKYNGQNATSVILNNTSFKPYDVANGLLDLGASNARWKGIYGNTLDLSGDATICGETVATQVWVNSQNFVNVEGGTINNAKLTGDVTGNGWSIEGGIANFGEVNTDSLYINGEEVLTSNSLANYVTLNTEQTISERKTFSKGIIGGLHSIEAPNSVFVGLDSTVRVYGGLTIGTGDLTTPSIKSDSVLPKSNSSGSIGSSSSKWRNGYINNLYSDVIYADTLTSSTAPYLSVTTASLDLMSCELYGYDSDGNANWNIAPNGIASLNSVLISSNDHIHRINGNADGELVIWPSEYLVIENDTITDYRIICSELVQTSDVRYKSIKENIHLELSDIAAAPTFKFSWTNETDGKTHIGTSAQYWQEIASELVVENKKTGKLGLDYSTAALVSAVSIAREVNTMKMWQTSTTDRIEELEDKVKKLEEENKALRELLNSK